MDKERKQQIILIILIPLFLFSLFYTRMRNKAKEDGEVTLQLESISADKQIDQIPSPDNSMDIEYAPINKDPLKNLLEFYIYKTRSVEQEEDLKVPLPALAVEGLIWNSDMPQAIVNGKVLRIGDFIEGIEIVNIEKQGITVDYNNERVLIERE